MELAVSRPAPPSGRFSVLVDNGRSRLRSKAAIQEAKGRLQAHRENRTFRSGAMLK